MKPDYRFAKDNKYFVLLSNIIHQNGGIPEELQDFVDEISKEKKQDDKCTTGEISEKISEKFNTFSMDAIHKDVITQDTLDIASKTFFALVFCPEIDPETIKFYQDLFEEFSLETVLKTLAVEKNICTSWNFF